MGAVILNAGDGGRLGLGLPKGCVTGGGEPLAWRIARLLDLEDPVMVVGYRADAVMEMFGSRFRYALNERWAETKTSGSLARAWDGGPTLVVAADHVFGLRFVERIEKMKDHPAAVLLDPDATLDGEEQVLLWGGKLAWPVPEGADVMGEVPEVFWCADGDLDLRDDEDVFEAFNRRGFDVLHTRGAPWTEIDTPEDLERARRMFGE
jgi:choline kinase